MTRNLICLALIVLMCACDPLDTGDPPNFSSASAVAISESQVQLTWDAGSDDIHPPEELHYQIWVAGPDETIDTDNLGDADFATDEGALSFNLIGLDADTSYTILVRAADRANETSTNTSTASATTTTVGNGQYGREVATSLTNTPDAMLCGRMVSGLVDDIGIISGQFLRWYTRSADGTYTASDRRVSPYKARIL